MPEFPQPDLTALDALYQGDYDRAITGFEAVGDSAYLGIAYLLSGDEMTAQLTWMAPLMEGGDEDQWTQQLTASLHQAACQHPNPGAAFVLRQQLQDINGDHLENRLGQLELTIQLNLWDQGSFDEEIENIGQALQEARITNQSSLWHRFRALQCWRAWHGADWPEAQQAFEQHRQHLEQLISSEAELSLELASQLITAGGMMAYLTDDLPAYRQLRNQIGTRCQAAIQQHLAQVTARYQRQSPRESGDILKIGYLSECFRQHSVGWLVRWLLQYHDRQRFEIHLYSLSQTGDRLQQQFANDTTLQFHPLPYSGLEAAERIHRDKIDILVDLDSITSNAGCSTLALKPAPIQVSWLGCDAPGLPAVDYFLVDSYVLGDEAEHHYPEKLWRLPHSYIAVDGFEMGIPSLRRDRLDIPTDAVVYFCSQSGYKRNPNDSRRQLQILAQVPNSYLLIKGVYSDATSLQQQFQALADAEGVGGDRGSRTLRDRLRFLPVTPSEEIHRANLALADVVLDTYPYNGTTTTLEALWAGIPVVSQVGQQFASRQGYTLLKHAGVEAGIAFSDEEYVDWGVRLGQDVALRRQVSQQLLRNRRTAPLWNARQFTREVEQMYQLIANR